MISVGENICRIRMFRLIGQKEMAKHLQISQQEYSKLEKKPLIQAHILAAIADKLGCSVRVIKQLDHNTFFKDEPEQQNGNNRAYDESINKLRQLLKELEVLHNQQQELISSIINGRQ